MFALTFWGNKISVEYKKYLSYPIQKCLTFYINFFLCRQRLNQCSGLC